MQGRHASTGPLPWLLPGKNSGNFTRQSKIDGSLAARAAYQIPGTDKRMKSGQKLGEGYQAIHLPVGRRRLAQGGMRLATVLNEAFAEQK